MAASKTSKNTFPQSRALRGPVLWFQVEEILVWLTIGYMPAFAQPHKGFSGSKCVNDPTALPQPSGWVEIDKEGLALLKLKLDTLFRLMNKVLPDLKAMEFQDITASTSVTRDPVTLARQVRGMLAIEDASRVPPTSTRVQ
jgi:hypothetical protein